FGFAENTDDLFVGKTLLHGDVLMWLMKTLLTSGCTNQRGAGQLKQPYKPDPPSLRKPAPVQQTRAEQEAGVSSYGSILLVMFMNNA
ncbi:hypothetical protein CP998_19145, partial [Enterobacter hormaechei]